MPRQGIGIDGGTATPAGAASQACSLSCRCGCSSGQPAWSQAGRSTGLPLPRFVSLAADRVNVRFGPGKQYPVNWVFARKGLPVEIIAEFDTWRKIRDYDGEEGWIHSSLLSSRRTIMVTGEVRDAAADAEHRRARGAARRAGRDRQPVRLRGELVPGRDRRPPRLAAAQRVLGHAARRDRALGRASRQRRRPQTPLRRGRRRRTMTSTRSISAPAAGSAGG